MKKLKKIDGSCAVVALHYASGQPEETTLRVCTLHGFEVGQGMFDEEWRAAAAWLGLKLRAEPIEPQRLRKFLRAFPKGLFIVGTCDHLFVVDNGVIIDPRHPSPPGLDRVVQQMWRVLR